MHFFMNILKGFIIGGSMSAPGVSGGTMAILLNCYNDLIRAVSSFTKDIKKNFLFLLQFAVGGGLGLLLLSKLIETGLEHQVFGQILRCLFVGFVLGGLPLIFKMTKTSSDKKPHVLDYLFAVLGFAIVIALTFLPEDVINLADSGGIKSVLFLLLAGFVVAIGLVLPGISAMGMLAALGLYEVINSAISQLNIGILLPLGVGGIVGIFSTTKIIEQFMDKHPRRTYLLIIGFVLGSALQILPTRSPQGFDILYWVLAAALGFAAIYLLSRIDNKEISS